MALVLRTVTGTLKKASGAEWEGGKVRFSLVSTQADTGGLIVPNLTVEAIAGAQGAFSVALYTLEGSYLNYFVMLPTGETQEISLPDGVGDALLADLLETAAQSEEIAIRPATDTTLGGVMGDGSTVSIDENGVISVVGGGGVSDHGALTGLADDDHTQYHTDARGDLRYVGAAPPSLNTFEKVATALGDDPDFAGSIGAEFLLLLYKAQNLADLPNPATARTNLGLGNVDNTSDANKPVSTATQTALDAKVGLTGNETIAGVKTFSSSPVVPTPTTDFQAATKKYVDDNAGGGGIGGDVGVNDNAIVRADGTGGDTAQGSAVIIDDSGNIKGTGNLGVYGNDTLSLGGANGAYANVIFHLSRTAFMSNVAGTTTTPAAITSNQNDYQPTAECWVLRLSSDASRDITGFVQNIQATFNQLSGLFKILINVGDNDIVLKHENAGSAATNRFLNSTGTDITLSPNQAAELIYDGTTERWRVFKKA